jgi:hippurate hydrolase
MDALPITERNSFAHASREPGKMHACGHDGHSAMLLAAAQHLARNRHFDGTAVLIFQPAEEGGGGALTMVQEGLFAKFPVEAVFGMHNWPGLPVGAMAVSPGPVMASANDFNIVIRGTGSHAAMPHQSVDPVLVACHLIQAAQTVVSRNLNPLDTAVLSVTIVRAGEASNVIPQSCEIRGTVRTFRSDVLDRVEARLGAIAHGICASFGAACEFEFIRRAPPVVNHEREARFAARVMRAIVGEAGTLDQEPAMASEDFAYMLQAKAGCYCFIGNGEGRHRDIGHGDGPCMLHNPSYDFNDELIPLGATYWVRLVEAWLGASRSNP